MTLAIIYGVMFFLFWIGLSIACVFIEGKIDTDRLALLFVLGIIWPLTLVIAIICGMGHGMIYLLNGLPSYIDYLKENFKEEEDE